MRLDGGMIHTRACMQWCAYYTWERLHSIVHHKDYWLTDFMSTFQRKVDHFGDFVHVQCIYLQDLRRITFNFKPTAASETYSVYVRLDKPLGPEAIWAVRRAPYDPALETGEETWDIDQLFQGFDYRHLAEDPINLE